MTKKKTIVICSSGSFYKHVNQIADELKSMGWKVVVPATAKSMKKTGNYDIDSLKSWYKDPNDFKIKAKKMRDHFGEVAAADAVLIINDEKNGQKSYIGPNGLMEMGLAFYLGQPIYILNNVPADLPIYEEVYGMNCVILEGGIEKIKL
ncbi:hypothetical protein HYW36_02960 [Candidatus Saccharibacteria bacterium]|nr:hypothetical protein [Candidatus Saccharibacteria bacterium]